MILVYKYDLWYKYPMIFVIQYYIPQTKEQPCN